MKTELPLVLAQAKLIAGEVDIQLTGHGGGGGGTQSGGTSNTLINAGITVDSADITVDDNNVDVF